MSKEQPSNKDSVLRNFIEINRDASLTDTAKQQRKDVVMIETLLEIRDLLSQKK